MLVWLVNWFAPMLRQMELHTAGDSRVFLTARTALASMTAFVLAIALGPLAIRWLRGRFRERIASASKRLNEIQASKQSTPTMGGLFIVASIVIGTLLFGDLTNPFTQLALLTTVCFGALGACDDWIKLNTPRNGLSVRQKFAAQVLFALVIGSILYWHQRTVPHGLELVWPLGAGSLWLGGGFIAWSVLVIVGTSNAVNLTDGLDGLAAGCAAIVLLAYLGITFLTSDYDLAMLSGCLVGGCVGFLWFNAFPATVFMGDTGSLGLGGAIAGLAVMTKTEVLLILIGGIFVIEALSVVIQVISFQTTRKRVFLMAPIHHHFELKAWSETKIILRFWIIASICAAIGFAIYRQSRGV
jgi:phospho-N-acetylmuramoyl-pentapeptide-transferase